MSNPAKNETDKKELVPGVGDRSPFDGKVSLMVRDIVVCDNGWVFPVYYQNMHT